MLPRREEIAYSTPYSDQRLFKTYMPPSVAVFSNGAPWQHPQPPHTNDTELHTEKPALSTALIHLQTQAFSPAGRYRGLRRAVCLLPRHPLTRPQITGRWERQKPREEVPRRVRPGREWWLGSKLVAGGWDPLGLPPTSLHIHKSGAPDLGVCPSSEVPRETQGTIIAIPTISPDLVNAPSPLSPTISTASSLNLQTEPQRGGHVTASASQLGSCPTYKSGFKKKGKHTHPEQEFESRSP